MQKLLSKKAVNAKQEFIHFSSRQVTVASILLLRYGLVPYVVGLNRVGPGIGRLIRRITGSISSGSGNTRHNMRPRKQVSDAHSRIVADCGKKFHTEGNEGKHPSHIGDQKQEKSENKRDIPDDGLPVTHGRSRILRERHANADEFFADALAVEQAVADKDIPRCRQKTEYVRQFCQADNKQEIHESRDCPGSNIRPLQ
jgi:hypothetical protein